MNENNLISIKNIGKNIKTQKKIISQIIVVGDQNVGKTSLINKFLFPEKKINLDNYIPTNSFELLWNNYLINEKEIICLQFWDITGNECYQQYAENFYKKCSFVFFIYSIDNKKSFLNINKWIEYYKKYNNEKDNILYLIGNKNDLENKREISYEEGLKFSEEKNFSYFVEININDEIKMESLINKTINKLYNLYLQLKNENDINNISESEDSCISIEISESRKSLNSIKKDKNKDNFNNNNYGWCFICILI